jgi:hypothetical protein
MLGSGIRLKRDDLGVRFTSWFVHDEWFGARDAFYGFPRVPICRLALES